MVNCQEYAVDKDSLTIYLKRRITLAELFGDLYKLWHHPLFRDVPFPFDDGEGGVWALEPFENEG